MHQAGRVWYLEWIYWCQTPWGAECGPKSGGPVPFGPRTGQSRVRPWADSPTQGPWPWRRDSETLGWFGALGRVPERPWLRGRGLSPQRDPAPVWDSKKDELDLWSQQMDSARPSRPLLVWDSEKWPLGPGQFKKIMCSVVRCLTIGPMGLIISPGILTMNLLIATICMGYSRWDSNPQPSVPKTDALPLSHWSN